MSMIVRAISRPSVVTAQGMDLTASVNPNSTAITKLAGWTPRANTTVTSNEELRAVGTGPRTVTASVNFTGTGFSYSHRTYVYVNGVEALVSVTRTSTGPLEVTGTLQLNDGDLLDVRAWSSFSSRSGVGASGTFLSLVPA